MNQLAYNIRIKRKALRLTQEELAIRLGVTRSAIGAYEEGRAEPRLPVLMFLAELFGCTIDALVNADLSNSESSRGAIDMSGARLRVLPVLVDEAGKEQISVVPVQAAAGYLAGHRDADFVMKLPAFNLPVRELQAERTYRLFQIKGDSMLPVPDGAYVIAEYVQDWRNLRDYQSYVVVSKSDGVVYKRVVNLPGEALLELRSDNPAYQPYRIPMEEVMEFWRGLGYISFALPAPGDGNGADWQRMLSDLQTLIDRAQGRA